MRKHDLFGCVLFLVLPLLSSCSRLGRIQPNHAMLCDTGCIRRDLDSITMTPGFRNYRNKAALNRVADYIHTQLREQTDSVSEQPFRCNDGEYRNIIASFNTDAKERIIIGAVNSDAICGG